MLCAQRVRRSLATRNAEFAELLRNPVCNGPWLLRRQAQPRDGHGKVPQRHGVWDNPNLTGALRLVLSGGK